MENNLRTFIMKIAVLALQGAFAEHQQMLHSLGVESVLIRNLRDWQEYIDEVSVSGLSHGGLVIPGGESTAMQKIMTDTGLLQPLRQAIKSGLPVLGTCAGLIMLDTEHIATMDIYVRRNAYGRQLGSFVADADFKGIGRIPMVFIRAPYIEKVGDGVDILSVVDGHIVAARNKKQLVTAFHPELTGDTRVHEYFINQVVK